MTQVQKALSAIFQNDVATMIETIPSHTSSEFDFAVHVIYNRLRGLETSIPFIPEKDHLAALLNTLESTIRYATSGTDYSQYDLTSAILPLFQGIDITVILQ